MFGLVSLTRENPIHCSSGNTKNNEGFELGKGTAGNFTSSDLSQTLLNFFLK